jgi:DNA repair protein SbcD/Mre11
MQLFHIADAHIDRDTYGKTDLKTGQNSRQQDFIAALTRLIDLAIQQQVDAVLFAGDAFKTANPSERFRDIFTEQVKRCCLAGIPVIMVSGNHDRSKIQDVLSVLNPLKYIEGVTLFQEIGVQTITTKSGDLQVLGVPWQFRQAQPAMRGTIRDDVTRASDLLQTQIEQAARSLDPTLPAVLLGHVDVQGAILAGSETASHLGVDPSLPASFFQTLPVQYVALGHVHKHQNMSAPGQIPVVYAGSIERCDFAERNGQKGGVIVSLNGQVPATYDFCAIPARPFVQLEYDLKEVKAPEMKLYELVTRDRDSISAGAVVKIRYTAQTRIPHDPLFKLLPQVSFLVIEPKLDQPKRIHQRLPLISPEDSILEVFDQYIAQHPYYSQQPELCEDLRLVTKGLIIAENHN